MHDFLKLKENALKKLDLEMIDLNAETFFCKICYNDVDIKQIIYLNCYHYFCKECF